MAATDDFIKSLNSGILKAEREYRKNADLGDIYTQALNAYTLVELYSLLRNFGSTEDKRKALGKVGVYSSAAENLRKKVIAEREKYEKKSEQNNDECDPIYKNVLEKFYKGTPNCKFWFNTILGLEEAKSELLNGFVNPLLFPSLFPGFSKGILFYGPPGTGKTLLARATTNELVKRGVNCLKIHFFAPQGSDLKDKYVGGTEEKINKLFKCASDKASSGEKDDKNKNIKHLSVIFLDEVEAVAGDRSKDSSGTMTSSVNALLQAMDGIKSKPNVVVMAATNYPWQLDGAFLRRFDTRIFVDLPNEENIFKQLNSLISNYIEESLGEKKKEEEKEDESCQEPKDNADYFRWNGSSYNKYTNISADGLRKISQQLANKSFSGSDVNSYFKSLLRATSTKASKNAKFFKAEISGKEVFLSTLGLKDPSSVKKEDLKIIPGFEIPNIKEITLKENKRNKRTFVHSYLSKQNIIINDPLIKNTYIEDVGDGTFSVLFEFTLKIKGIQEPEHKYILKSEEDYYFNKEKEPKNYDGIFEQSIFYLSQPTNTKTILEWLKSASFVSVFSLGLITNKNKDEKNNKDLTEKTLLGKAFKNGRWIIGSGDLWGISEEVSVDPVTLTEGLSETDLTSSVLYPGFDNHPIKKAEIEQLKRFGLAVAAGDRLAAAHFDKLGEFTRTKNTEKENNEKLSCDAIITRNSKFLNWTIPSDLMTEVFMTSTSTFNKKLYEKLKKYKADPNALEEEEEQNKK